MDFSDSTGIKVRSPNMFCQDYPLARYRADPTKCCSLLLLICLSSCIPRYSVVGSIRLRSMPLHSRRHSRHPGKVLGQRFCGQSGALFPLRGFSKIDPPSPPPREERSIRNGKMVPQRNMLFRAGPKIRIRSLRHTWWKEKVNLLFSDLDMHGYKF